MALLAAISKTYGLESYLVKEGSINQFDFAEFLKHIRRRHPESKIGLFLDNLSVHKASLVAKVAEEVQVQLIFNVPYSPQFNGIEMYWSLVKRVYKNSALQRLLKGNHQSDIALIKSSLLAIPAEQIKNCAMKGL